MMNIPPSNKLPRSHFPADLIAEILSWLPVKSLMRFSWVCKSWNTLFISDPTFIKLHLQRSALRGSPRLLLQWNQSRDRPDFAVKHFSGPNLVENRCHSPAINNEDESYEAVGSCNGLICLYGYSSIQEKLYGWLCFWNPTTRLISAKLGSFKEDSWPSLSFGYDPSTNTYKVVKYVKNSVSVFTLGNNVWRDIQKFPLLIFDYDMTFTGLNEGVQLNGTLNWIATREAVPDDQFEILSLDLTTETTILFTPPPGFKKAHDLDVPSIGVLVDCLCFSHDLKSTHLVIWQMKEFGVAGSWSQLVKISYQDLQIDPLSLDDGILPLCLLSNSDTVMLEVGEDGQVILYNRSSNTVEHTTISNDGKSWFIALNYVESLVSPY